MTTRSERLNIALEPQARAQLQDAADKDRVSLNQFIRDAIGEKINDQARFGRNYRIVRSLWERLDPEELETTLMELNRSKRR